ncbi:LysM peptidoglycan-binding domain-containing protein [Demequina globuliformis]|uniref:LysM peptidoglycan-binding domain-containing protein n=1 Tax=Demequina globuliformis TaxID=676202 RepID=UPI0007847E02|nr:LysM peptidoglycan-binding domain-containing protein [Demequina globuliformis]
MAPPTTGYPRPGLGRTGAVLTLAGAPAAVVFAAAAGRALWADVAGRPLAMADLVVLAACAVCAAIGTYLTVAALAIAASTGSERLRAAVAKVTPQAWRRVVSAALGVGLSAGVAAPGFATVDEAPDQAGWLAQPTASVDHAPPAPRERPHIPRPSEVASHEQATSAPPAVTSAPEASSAVSSDGANDTAGGDAQGGAATGLTVTPGDSLWTLTADALGDGATPTDVATHWPELYDQNKGLIGEDPDMIHPGMVLEIPKGWTA